MSNLNRPIKPAGALAGGRAKSLGASSTVLTGALIVAGFFGLGGVWAVTAKLESAVIAPGELVMEGNRTRVQHLEGGIVASIDVTDGDRVESGQALIRLEDVRARAQVVALRAEYYDGLARAARLRAESANLEDVEFPATLVSAASNPEVQEVMDMQRQVFQSRRTALRSEKDILASRIPQYYSMISGLDAQLSALKSQQEIYNEELQIVEGLLEKGLERRPKVLQLRRATVGIKGEIGDLIEKRGQTSLAISEIEMRLIDMDNSRMAAIDAELSPLLSQLIDLEDRLRAAEDQLERTVIRAPVSGFVVALSVHNKGAIIQSGTILLSIVPDDEAVVVNARLMLVDVNLVMAGQPAKVILSAFKQSEVEPIEASVLRISADRLEDERTGEPYFETVLEFHQGEGGEGNLTLPKLVPGMPVEVYIKTGSRTPLAYFLQPLRDSFRRAMKET